MSKDRFIQKICNLTSNSNLVSVLLIVLCTDRAILNLHRGKIEGRFNGAGLLDYYQSNRNVPTNENSRDQVQ